MSWTVQFTAKAAKQTRDLPFEVNKSLKALVEAIKAYGPALPEWPNFSKLKGKSDCYHCHIKKGRPTYVAVWQVINDEIKIVEIKYVGTHEGANYRRIC
jgi:mRNA-degrading endonuclease RelE of RelBE toxin-antitoxin system